MKPHYDNLKTSFLGFSLVNPFVVASASPTASLDLIRRSFAQGWGGAVTKTIKPDSQQIADVSPRFHALRDSSGAVVGFENIELVSKKDESYWMRTISSLKSEYPDRMVIASLMGTEKDNWQKLARKMEEAGADALELNFSCPHGMPEKGGGAAIGQHPEIVGQITGWVKAVAKTPVIVKLTPNITDIRVAGKAALDAGADSLAAINTVESITGVDLDSFQPYPLVGGGRSTYGGYSGAGVKPIGLRAVAQLASAFPQVPLFGMGGIRTWQDAAEYIALGAQAVQVCTEVMVSGFGIVSGLNKGLVAYLTEKAFASPEDLKGRALANLGRHDQLPRNPVSKARVVRPSDCIVCGKCLVACRDGGYQAVSISDKKVTIIEELCDGCSLCRFVCPQNVIAMERLAAV